MRTRSRYPRINFKLDYGSTPPPALAKVGELAAADLDPEPEGVEVEKIDRAVFRCEDGGIIFCREIFGLQTDSPKEPDYMTEYQQDIFRAIWRERRVAVRSNRGAGKTAIASWFIWWLLFAFDDTVDTKIPCTAGSWNQLKRFLFPEVHKWASRANWAKLGVKVRKGKELLDLSVKLRNKEAFAIASDDPELIEGAHAKVMGYVFDEAKSIKAATFDAAEGALSNAGDDNGNEAFVLMISTPGVTAGRFYDIHTGKPGYQEWWTRHVTLEETIAARRLTRQWVDRRKEQWGEESPLFKNHVEGEFSDSAEQLVVPLSWVEAANKRHDAIMASPPPDLERWRVAYGLDPAGEGADSTALCKLLGWFVQWIDYTRDKDPLQVGDYAVAKMGLNKDAPIAVDVIGVGAGTAPYLVRLGYSKTISVNVSTSAENMTDETGKTGFFNLRSAIWWLIRDALNPKGQVLLALPRSSRLTNELTTPTWWHTSNGKIRVEGKDEYRERLEESTSTDGADALGLALYAVHAKKRIRLQVS